MIRILAAIISILFLALGGILVIVPVVYIIGIYTYEWTGIGWEHEPLLPPFQLLETGLLYGVPILLIALFFFAISKSKT